MTKSEHIDADRRIAGTINHCPKCYRGWRVKQWAQHIKEMLAIEPVRVRGQGRLL